LVEVGRGGGIVLSCGEVAGARKALLVGPFGPSGFAAGGAMGANPSGRLRPAMLL